jgi:hypothetical protein
MRKLIGFFAGLTIIALVLAAVFAAIRLYDYADASNINSVLLQPADLWQNRMDAPIPLEKISDEYVRDRLMAKFVSEYMRVIPSRSEIGERAGPRGALRLMSAPDVFSKWERDARPDLEKMAAERKRRIVSVGRISKQGDYFVVPFLTKTWNNPNRLDDTPVVSSGREMYMKIRFNKKVRKMMGGSEFDAGRWMSKGLPPTAIFEFIVDEVFIK